MPTGRLSFIFFALIQIEHEWQEDRSAVAGGGICACWNLEQSLWIAAG